MKMMARRPKTMEIADRIFLAVIALIMFGIIATFNLAGEVSKENRNLTKLPALFSNGAVNRDVIENTDNYIADRFGFRETLVSWNAYLFVNILGTSPSDKVILGKNNFMFYVSKPDGDNLSDFLKTNRLNSQQLLAIKTRLEENASWCEKNGIKFLFATTPSKHSIYEEHYPLARPDGPSRLDQIIDYMDAESEIKIMDFRTALIKEKANRLVYSETGTHWNENGAYIAYRMIFNEVKSMFPGRRFNDGANYAMAAQLERDEGLTPLIGIDSKEKISGIRDEPKTDYPYTYEKHDGRDSVITVHGDQSLPKAIIFRDSFFDALQPLTSTLFSRATYRWKLFTEADKKVILEQKPDLIIFEVTERYMYQLAW